MDLRTQLFSQPTTLVVTAVILLVFAALPGIPALPFVLVSCVAAAAGMWLIRKEREMPSSSMPSAEFRRGSASPAGGGAGGESDSYDDSLIIELDRVSLFRLYRSSASRHLATWSSFKEEFYNDVGISLPEISVRVSDRLPASAFRVTRGGVEMLSGDVVSEGAFMEISSSQAHIVGLTVVREEEHPVQGIESFGLWLLHGPERLLRLLDFARETSLSISRCESRVFASGILKSSYR